MRAVGLCLVLVAASCGRSGELVPFASSEVADLAGPADLAAGTCGGGLCPPPLQCVDGQCCGGMICIPPPQACDRQHPCPFGEQCLMGVCLPAPPDFGRPRDMRRDMGPPDLATPPPDLATVSDGGLPSGCTSDSQCPGARCDWLTGQCVPIMSCNVDRNCPTGSACVAHQCLPIQICLPFPGAPACPVDTHCAFPPGVCVPNANCGPGIGACPGGESCVRGYCQPDSCTSSAQCNDGYDCVGGVCTPRRYCGPFERCPRPLHCSAHVCIP